MMLRGEVAIVTGSSRGIGKGIARKFLAEGANVLLIATNEPRLAETSRELATDGVEVSYLAGDIADPAVSERAVSTVMTRYGRVDIAVNCAGVITRQPVEVLPDREWGRVLDVNLSGPCYLARAVLPHMRERRSGKIINIVSQMAKLPHPGASPSYEVSKAGLMALTRHLALHYAPHGVRVNGIAPGTIETGLQRDMKPEALARIVGAIPMNRLGQIDEVAQAALFLASEMSSYITGEILDVNGGSLMD